MTRPSLPRATGAAVRAAGWGWRHAGRDDWAVHDLELAIEPGERVLLLGPSGAGKSTLLHALAGVLGGAEDGEERGLLHVDGAKPVHQRARIGMVLQDPDSQVILSRVGDDVAFGLENFLVPRAEIWGRVTESLRAVGLDVPLGQNTAELSGGQKQRLALAGVVAMHPGLLLLDEPTANLDPAGVLEVRDAITRTVAESQATLVVIEHRTEVWLPVVDRVIVLGPGGDVVADGTPEATIRREQGYLERSGVWIPGADLPAVPRRRPTTPDPLLHLEDLSLGYGGARTLHAGLDFTLARGRIAAVTGPNGAGKSTLALTVGGLLPPAAGRVRAADAFAPSPRRVEPVRWRSTELLTRIGSVFQDPEHQFLTGSVRDELALGPRALKRGTDAVAARIDELLVRLRLDRLADANPYTLSGGEKRRLSVATALATGPDLIVLDEPTFGQDRRTWEELIRMLDEITGAGTAIVAVTHDLDFVALLADHTLELPAWQAAHDPAPRTGVHT